MVNKEKKIKVNLKVEKIDAKAGRGRKRVLDLERPAVVNLLEKRLDFSGDKGVDKDKKLMMWTGVGFFMVFFLAVWTVNIKSVFKHATKNGQDSGLVWTKIEDEVSKTVTEIKKGLGELRAIVPDISSTSPELISSTTVRTNIQDLGDNGEENIRELKEKLIEIEKNLKTSN